MKRVFVKNSKKPLAQIFREGNSRSRFVNELRDHEEKVFNSSFDTVQSSLSKKPATLRQTQICVRRSLKRPYDSSFITADKLETKTELFLMPMPNKTKANNDERLKLNSTTIGQQMVEEKPFIKNNEELGANTTDDPMDTPQRNMRVFVGNVDFVIKSCNLKPDINALWDVYGKLVKVTKGKHRFEQSLLIRNLDGSGPILQCAYFDFDNIVQRMTLGSKIRVVGKLCGLNCLRTFRIDQCIRDIHQSNFIRIQNVNSFVLLQNKNTN
ncbi:uncharacterized protein isoform X2 [Musca autumnalis]|uniref:uncharacterized protein isoform X2 n=1 Tax=Musca autumnalis TaxID=221902 RepID=UPI003CF41619